MIYDLQNESSIIQLNYIRCQTTKLPKAKQLYIFSQEKLIYSSLTFLCDSIAGVKKFVCAIWTEPIA